MKKKIIPILAAVFLIIIVGAIGFISKVIERYTPTDERQDLTEYYGISSDDEVVLILGDNIIEDKGKLYNGVPYINHETVKTYLNNRFYWDTKENVMLYTTPDDVISVNTGSNDYYITKNKQSESYTIVRVEGEEVYIAAEFVQKYTNMEYTLYEKPNRMTIEYEWDTVQVAEVKKEDAVRVTGGIKSEILTDVEKGSKLRILEEMDEWTKVMTEDGFIGYIQNARLSAAADETKSREFEEMVYSNISKDYTINMLWHQVTNYDANDEILNIIADTKGVNTISPTWFYLKDSEGNISTYLASKDYVNYAHQADMEVWGLINNFDNYDENPQDVNTHEILSSSKKRETLINQLIAAAIEYGLDGINIDFEDIDEETGDHYIQFIRELSIKCRKMNIVLSVDNPVPMPYTMHYNRKEQGIVADYVIIMGYDEHYSDSQEYGSVASLPFVISGIEETIKEVPAAKVINAVPFYTRIWIEKEVSDGDTTIESWAVGMQYVDDFIEQNQADITKNWSDETSQYYAEGQLADGFYRVWLEEETSLDLKVKLIKDYNLAGVAAWKYGFERSSIYDTILKYTN